MADKNIKTDGAGELVGEVDAAYDTLDEEARQVDVGQPPAAPKGNDLRKTWVKIKRLREDATKLQDSARQEKRDAEQQKHESERERSEIEKRHSAAVEKERELQERELNAEHGFRAQNEIALRAQEERATELREEISKLERKAAAARAALDQELEQLRREQLETLADEIQQIRNTTNAELEKRRAALDEEQEELIGIGKESRRQRREFEAEKAVLEDERSAMVQEIERRHAAKLEELEAANGALSKRLDQAREDRARVEAELTAAQESIRVLDGRPLDVIAEDLKNLRAERDRLAQELAERPDGDQTAELGELRRAHEALTDELADVRRERNELRIAQQRERGHLAQVEVLSDKARALESTISAYKTALDEQKQDFDELVDKQATRSPFERMSHMDDDARLNEPPTQVDKPTDLTSFVAQLQHRIAAEPLRPGEPLFFSLRDLRVFVAGVAMSRLHLLQGISGTGKTSLPLAFARAVGGGSDVVEVQAGWRDRQDLLGHYNTFERRYDETTFVQALYRAQSEAYADRPYLVVLDEMNLSHPEQYFADLLSALERGDPRLTLTNTSLEPAPSRLEEGRILRIPDNVWFIGTANHDETTMGFADKTYDRAHVQELPTKRAEFSPQKPKPHGSVSLIALEELFAQASQRRSDDADIAGYYLQSALGEILNDRFNVGWGNRLDKQLRSFVPVVIEAGGSIGEAVDHLLATKILRKVRDRHDISTDDIEALSERLENSWPDLSDDGAGPVWSRQILDREKRRLSGGLG